MGYCFWRAYGSEQGDTGLSCGPMVKNLPATAGTRIESLVREDSTCCWAAESMRHNYWSPGTLESTRGNKRNCDSEKPAQHSQRGPCSLQPWEKALQLEDPAQPKIHKQLLQEQGDMYPHFPLVSHRESILRPWIWSQPLSRYEFHTAWPLKKSDKIWLWCKETTISSILKFKWLSRVVLTHQIFVIQ